MSGYVIQYVPLSGLGQPITADMRQVNSAVESKFLTPGGDTHKFLIAV